MIKVIFKKENDEYTVDYTAEEVAKHGREAIVEISDQTIALSNYVSYMIIEED